MGKLLFKTFQWAVSMSALICAIHFMQVFGNTNEMKYMGIIVPCLALVFWFSKTTYEASKTVMIRGFAVLVVAGGVAYFGMNYLVGYIPQLPPLGFFMAWELLLLAAGVPLMLYTFHHDK